MRSRALAALVLLTAVALAPAASAGLGMPDALTPRGRLVEGLYTMIALLGIAMFCIVFVWLVVAIWRFREGTGHGKATHEKERHSLKAEMAWTLIPLAIVLWIGYAAYGGLVELDHGIPIEDAQMEVKVEATQWNWQFDYGQGVRMLANPDLNSGNVSAANTFLVPQDTNILFNITSGDVIHAFQVMDSNRAFVAFLDANPLGANKHNLQTANFPPGDYLIQCNKMCLNPGHAYMRGAIKAVPRAEFDHWLAGKSASAGASLVQTLPIQFAGGKAVGLDSKAPTPLKLAVSHRLVVDVRGAHGDLDLSAAGTTRHIAANEATNTFATFDFPAAGSFNLTIANSEGGKTTTTVVPIQVKQAQVVTVNMKNFFFEPKELRFEVGKSYLIQAVNAGESAHDLNIGHWNGGNAPTRVFRTDLVGPGGTISDLFEPTEAGSFDLWCNPHATMGMLHQGAVTVA